MDLINSQVFIFLYFIPPRYLFVYSIVFIIIDGSFFISFGSGTAKREKPLALTPKKNLIFVKSMFYIHLCIWLNHLYKNEKIEELF